MTTLLRRLFVVTLLVVVLLQTGCSGSEEDRQLVSSLVQEYLESKNISPVSSNDKGEQEFDFWGTVGAIRTIATGSTGDEEADAVLGIYTSVRGVIEADKAMDAARANGDADAMDAVIASRPNDWTYHASRSVLAVVQGDSDRSSAEGYRSAELALEQGVSDARYARQMIKDYQVIVPHPETHLRCKAIYDELAWHYKTLAEATGQQLYFDQAGWAADQRGKCP